MLSRPFKHNTFCILCSHWIFLPHLIWNTDSITWTHQYLHRVPMHCLIMESEPMNQFSAQYFVFVIHAWTLSLFQPSHIQWNWCATDSFNAHGTKFKQNEQCEEIFVFARVGMHQGDIAARDGVARKTVNSILLRQASLQPRKPTGAPGKTTAHQECTLFRMVQENRFNSARALTEGMRNLYGMRLGHNKINNRLALTGSRGSPCLLPIIAGCA